MILIYSVRLAPPPGSKGPIPKLGLDERSDELMVSKVERSATSLMYVREISDITIVYVKLNVSLT